MTIRKLPEVPAIKMRTGLGFELSPSALGKWQAEIQAAASEDNNVISILGTIGEDFFGNGITARRVSAALRAIGDNDVVVHINSPGGDFFEGLAIYNLLREHKNKVTVKVLGMAASAASIIAMAGDHIEVPRAGFLMIHNVWVVAVGDRHDLRDFADQLEPFDKAAIDVYAARSGLEAKEIGKMMDRETWISGSDAVDKGFADDLLPADQVSKNPKALGELGVNAAAHRVDVLLAQAGCSRSERRRLIGDLKSGTPSAADNATQDAGKSDFREILSRIDIPLST